jgi:hypothetical protein
MYNTTGFTATELPELLITVIDYTNSNGIPLPRHSSLTLLRQIHACLIHIRRNRTQADIAETLGVSQPTISRVVSEWTDIIATALAQFVPTGDDLPEGTSWLVDGALVPCWSWKGHPEDYSGKHHTTGRNLIVAAHLDGTIAWVSDPFPGHTHDVQAIRQTGILQTPNTIWVGDKGFIGPDGIITPIRRPPGQDKLPAQLAEYNHDINQLRAPIERANAQLKTWRTLHTDYRRPHHTHPQTITAILGLESYKNTRE